MRLLGVLDPRGRTEERLAPFRAEGLELHAAADGPAVLTDVGGRFRPSVATRPDGSFAVVDGATVPADRVLDAWSAGRAEALGLDSTAAIWDAPSRTLSIVRDLAGVACVYWADLDGALVWSPDLPSILAVTGRRAVDRRTLDAFLADTRVPAPWSWVEGVAKVPPGHVLVQDRGGRRVERWAGLTARPRLELRRAEVVDRFDALLTDAVARRVVPGATGVLLSAGVDSTLLAAIAVRRLDEKVDTFTFRYDGADGDWNEGDDARETARVLGVPHHEILVTPDELARRFEWAVSAFGEPLVYGLHSYALGAAAGVDSLLSGAGADVLYGSGGSPRRAAVLGAAPGPLRRAGLAVLDAARARSKRVGTALAAPFVEPWEGTLFTIANPVERSRLYLDPGIATEGRELRRQRMRELEADHAAEPAAARSTFAWAEVSNEMSSFWNGRWSRVHDVAIREPFHDAALLADLRRMPLGSRRDKPESRLLAARMLPSAIAHRPKNFQAVPVTAWFRGPLRDFIRDALAPARLERGALFDPGAVTALLDVHQRGEVDHGWLLLALASVTQWQLGVLAGAP